MERRRALSVCLCLFVCVCVCVYDILYIPATSQPAGRRASRSGERDQH